MTKQTINIGTNPDDGTGDTLRTAFGKVNDNFTEVYNTAARALPNSGGTIYGNMQIVGNLHIYGNTIYTTLGALAINSTSIIFNQDLTIYDEPVDNVSLLVNRGARPNVTITWNEITEQWTYTNDGSVYYVIPSNTQVEQVIANNVVMFNSANGIATNLTSVFVVTNSAYAFANTIYPYVNTSVTSSNNYANTIGSRANAFANVIGSRSNAWANVIGTIANNYSIYITELVGTSGNNWSNTYSNNVGVLSNTYCNVSTLSSNNYSGYMANAVNAYVNVSTLSANNYGGYMANGVNAYVNVSTLSSNNYSGYMANAVNAYANVVGISGNVYVNVSTGAANNYGGYMANAANDYANAVGFSGNVYANMTSISANNYANDTFLQLTGGIISGNLTVSGSLHYVDNSYIVYPSTYGFSNTANATVNAIALNNAINAAANLAGSVVMLPAGVFDIGSQITIKSNVAVSGVGYYHNAEVDTGAFSGTILNVKFGSGSGSSNNVTDAAFLMNPASKLENLMIDYPDQSHTSYTPTEFGSTIKLYSDKTEAASYYHSDVVIQNLYINKAWTAIDIRGDSARTSGSGRMVGIRVKDIKMTALRYGIRTSTVTDWTIIENVEQQPGWISAVTYTQGASLRDYVQKNCTFIEITGTNDWLKLNHCTAWAVNVGLMVYAASGPVTMNSCEFDACRTANIKFIGNCDNIFLKAVGCTFVSFDALAVLAGSGQYSGYVVLSDEASTSIKGIQLMDCYSFGPTKGWISLTGSSKSVSWIIMNGCMTNNSGAAGGQDYGISISGTGSVTDVICTNNILKGCTGVSTGTISGTFTNTGNIT